MTVTPQSDTSLAPRTHRRHGLSALTDVEVWNYTDHEIIGAAYEHWRSAAYSHYSIFLERHIDLFGMPHHLTFRFVCKFNRHTHPPQYRDRGKTGNGTQNMLNSAKNCDSRWGNVDPLSQRARIGHSTFSEAKHRTIIALRCARNKRSFNSVADPLYLMEIELLRPGTNVPSPSTVSRDVKAIYRGSKKGVISYFKNLPGSIHLAIDGWTSPQSSSILGIVAIWRDQDRLWRTILEFVRLTHAHKGDYLAKRTEECLRRYGIAEKVLSVCLDNAANNDTLVRQLAIDIPSFRGPLSRVRCFAHIVNLMAKAFLSLYSPAPRRKKAIDQAATSSTVAGPPTAQVATVSLSPGTEQTEGSGPNSGVTDANAPEIDEDKQEFDDKLVQKQARKSLEEMALQGVVPTSDDLAAGQTLMSRVAGLAHKLHGSPPVQAWFEELIAKDGDLEGNQRTLTERVPTCWDSDFDCLESHLHFKLQVQYMTEGSRFDLSDFALSPRQWQLANEMVTVLEIFKDQTKHFSMAEVPLIHETLPRFFALRKMLEAVRNDKADMSPLTRVAAHSALLVGTKYLNAMRESEVYFIAVAMCPTYKLKWFYDNGYSQAAIETVRAAVLNRFYSSYRVASGSANAPITPFDPETLVNNTHSSQPKSTSQRVNKYIQQHLNANESSSNPSVDSIEAYLSSEVVSEEVISKHGGLLRYCSNQLHHQPTVFAMALDYLTAPASSVDAERAFSNGRLMVNHLQHQMSSETFQAQMAVGSWFDTPLLPDVDKLSELIASKM